MRLLDCYNEYSVMKTITLIILPVDTTDIRRAVAATLAPYKHSEEPFTLGKYDYYTFDESGNDPAVPAQRIITPETEKYFHAGAIIDADGAWHDSGDFGWKMIAIGTAENNAAKKLWDAHFAAILKNSHGLLGVTVVTHQ